MLLTTLDNGHKVHAWFSHNAGHHARRVTTCRIEIYPTAEKFPSDEQPIGSIETEAVCSPRDQFNKAKGRKLAFYRALTTLFPEPGDFLARARIWEAYFQRDPKAKKVNVS